MELPGIKYEGGIERTVSSDDTGDVIIMYCPIDYFAEKSAYDSFVKDVERVVRTSDDYKAFVKWVKTVLGINFCQVSNKILDGDATIEMHHGPIFTLYDYVCVILNHFIATGAPISRFRVADAVINEHFALRVQVVMLAVTNHEAITNRDLFLNLKQGVGNITEFIKRYAAVFDDEQKYKIWNYINFSKANPTYDTGILDTDRVIAILK